MTLDEAVNERVSFLMEQVNPSNRQIVNKSLQFQAETLRTANREKLALLILQKKKQLEGCKDVSKIEEIYSQLDALEWLERQVVASFQ
jgi:propanediol dehydratase small subunit